MTSSFSSIAGRHRIGPRADDEQSGHAAEHLLGGVPMRMRVIPVGAGAAQRQGELIRAARTRRDGVHGAAVLVRRHGQAVPVHRRLLRQAVLQPDADRVTLERLDQGSGDQPVVGPELRRRPGEQRLARARRDQRALECIWRGTGVCEADEIRQRQPCRQRRRRRHRRRIDDRWGHGRRGRPRRRRHHPAPAMARERDGGPRSPQQNEMTTIHECLLRPSGQRASASMIAC